MRYVQELPTEPEETPIDDNYIVARCPICGQPIYYGDEDVIILDGHTDRPMHENCVAFRSKTLDWFCDVLGLDLCRGTAKEVYEG